MLSAQLVTDLLPGSNGAQPNMLTAFGDRLVFAVAQRDNTEEPAPDILFTTGVIARIGQIQRGLGGVQLLLQGEQRATSLQYTTTDGFLSAVVMPCMCVGPPTTSRSASSAPIGAKGGSSKTMTSTTRCAPASRWGGMNCRQARCRAANS